MLRIHEIPLQAHCVARAKGTPEQYPVRTRKLVRKAQAWWLLQLHQSPSQLEQGLWERRYVRFCLTR